ncbi:type I restriction enzyme HsdR N-terminal domain-containing protein [Lujinxingia sediminis]|nr:type I restriction enzyme HsdR N-terminal domain-containing protein [Lujinxingia sediminis]
MSEDSVKNPSVIVRDELQEWATNLVQHVTKERDVETGIVDLLLGELGYSHLVTYKQSVTLSELRIGSGTARARNVNFIADYVLGNSNEWRTPGKPWAVIEVKKNEANITATRAQAQSYADYLKVPYYVLIDNLTIILYQRRLTVEDKDIFTINLDPQNLQNEWEKFAQLRQYLDINNLKNECVRIRNVERETTDFYTTALLQLPAQKNEVIFRKVEDAWKCSHTEEELLNAGFWWGNPEKHGARAKRTVKIDGELDINSKMAKVIQRLLLHSGIVSLSVSHQLNLWERFFENKWKLLNISSTIKIMALQSISIFRTEHIIEDIESLAKRIDSSLDEWCVSCVLWFSNEMLHCRDCHLANEHQGTWTKIYEEHTYNEVLKSEQEYFTPMFLRAMLQPVENTAERRRLGEPALLMGPETIRFLADGAFFAICLSREFKSIELYNVSEDGVNNLSIGETKIPCGVIHTLPVVGSSGLVYIEDLFREDAAILGLTRLNLSLPSDSQIGNLRSYRGSEISIDEKPLFCGVTFSLDHNTRVVMRAQGWAGFSSAIRKQVDDQLTKRSNS